MSFFMKTEKKEADNNVPQNNESLKKSSGEKETTRSSKYFLPSVDIFEKNDTIFLKADVPGIKKDNIRITVDNSLLTIEAQIDLDVFNGLKPLYAEYRVGNYYRQFQLGEAIDSDRISAEVKNGVLLLLLPKKTKKEAISIQVK